MYHALWGAVPGLRLLYFNLPEEGSTCMVDQPTGDFTNTAYQVDTGLSGFRDSS